MNKPIHTTKSQRTWRDCQEINPWLFPSLVELRNDPGFVGRALLCIPEECVRDANRCPDPWRELSSLPFVKQGHREFFSAAASLVPAVERLAGIAWGEGSASSNVRDRLEKARTNADRARHGRKLFSAMFKADPQKLKTAAESKGIEEIVANFRHYEVNLRAAEAKRSGKSKALLTGEQPSYMTLCQREPISVLLVVNWLRCGGYGDPGFCFFSSYALERFFNLLGWPITEDHIEQLCFRRYLVKASKKVPLITNARRENGRIVLNTLESTRARREWPKNPLVLRTRIALPGREFHARAPR